MKITRFSDYSLRVMIFLGVKNHKASIADMSKTFNVSKNHLMKVVHLLVKLGYINSIRGKMGGVALARPPEAINLGDIIQQLEPHMDIVECFNSQINSCSITPACNLKKIFQEAKIAFIKTLQAYTLADLIRNKEEISLYIKP